MYTQLSRAYWEGESEEFRKMSTLGYIYSLTVNKCILVCERLQTKFLSTNSNQTISLVMKNNFTIIDKEKKILKRDIKK